MLATDVCRLESADRLLGGGVSTSVALGAPGELWEDPDPTVGATSGGVSGKAETDSVDGGLDQRSDLLLDGRGPLDDGEHDGPHR